MHWDILSTNDHKISDSSHRSNARNFYGSAYPSQAFSLMTDVPSYLICFKGWHFHFCRIKKNLAFSYLFCMDFLRANRIEINSGCLLALCQMDLYCYCAGALRDLG